MTVYEVIWCGTEVNYFIIKRDRRVMENEHGKEIKRTGR